MKQARRHIFQPTFPPTPKHTCRGGSHAYKDGERQRGRKNNTSKLFPLNCPSCSSLPVGIWPETSPTADRRNRSPGSTEKSVSMFSNVAVRSQSGTVSPPPNPEKFSFFFFFFLPRSSVLFSPVFRSPLTLSSVRYSSCCRWFSRSMLSFLRVSVFFASSGLSRGHHTLFHAEGVREREGGRARERGRGRERERERSGESVWRHEAGVDWIKNK